jgi:hypothetical protein
LFQKIPAYPRASEFLITINPIRQDQETNLVPVDQFGAVAEEHDAVAGSESVACLERIGSSEKL